MKRNFIALILACSACVTVSESAMADDKPFKDWESGFVPNGNFIYKIDGEKWDVGEFFFKKEAVTSIYDNHLQRNYNFFELVNQYSYVNSNNSFFGSWFVFQNPETKAYIGKDGHGYFASFRKN